VPASYGEVVYEGPHVYGGVQVPFSYDVAAGVFLCDHNAWAVGHDIFRDHSTAYNNGDCGKRKDKMS